MKIKIFSSDNFSLICIKWFNKYIQNFRFICGNILCKNNCKKKKKIDQRIMQIGLFCNYSEMNSQTLKGA